MNTKTPASVYGNPIPPRAQRLIALLKKHYERAFPAGTPPLLAAEDEPFCARCFTAKRIVQTHTPQAGDIDDPQGIVIGTIRMGFGHARMSIALMSAACHLGLTPYWFDLVSFPDTAGAKTIRSLERWYNLASRISQTSKRFNMYFWERITSAMALPLSVSYQNKCLSELFAPLYTHIAKDMPIICSHPWVAHGAVSAGFSTIINLVPDNLPLAFNIAEGSIHTVQSPSAYTGYRSFFGMDMKTPARHCLPKEVLYEVGHYVDHEIVYNIEKDCELRLRRAADGEPRRFLLTMGGAGAQIRRFIDIALYCKDALEAGKAQFFINFGDHTQQCELFQKRLSQAGLSWVMHTDWDDTEQFIQAAQKHPVQGAIHIFLFADFFPAVYATNLLMRISDILITKPSELSYYPVPKLFIHRVGRHEAWGAIRGSEIGDSTIETDYDTALHRILDCCIMENDLIKLYCRHIIANKAAGIYDGAYNAVKLAMKL